VCLFKKFGVETVYICFDADESGAKATESVSATLQAENIRTHAVNLPEGQDINDFFLLTPPAAGQAEFRTSKGTPMNNCISAKR
jgi:DNA primase